VLGTLEAVLGGVLLLSAEVDPEVLAPVAAAWGVASGTLLLAEGLRLRRFARTWSQAPGGASQGPSPAGNGRSR
jgi:hypothetical protein